MMWQFFLVGLAAWYWQPGTALANGEVFEDAGPFLAVPVSLRKYVQDPPLHVLVLAENGRWCSLPIKDTTAAPAQGTYMFELSPAAAAMLMPGAFGFNGLGRAYGEVKLWVYLKEEDLGSKSANLDPNQERSGQHPPVAGGAEHTPI